MVLMVEKNTSVLSLRDFQFLEDKDPQGIYDKETLKRLYGAITKLHKNRALCTPEEKRIWRKLKDAQFGYLLNKNSRSEGVLKIKGVLQIDGRFVGEINGPDMLIIGEPANLNAKIKAGTVICKGMLRGNAVVSEKIQIHESGRLLGNVVTPSLEIATGAVFKGKCTMVSRPKPVHKEVKSRFRQWFVTG